MYYGVQLATSGLLTGLYRTDVAANNLANVNTTGFKPDTSLVRQRAVVSTEDGVGHLPSNELLERLGAGVHLAPNRVNFGQGPLSETGQPLDVAIQGEGFFVVRSAASGRTDTIRLTRDGRFTLDAAGRLVSASTGMPVLNSANGVINVGGPDVRPERVTINGDGVVEVDGDPVGRLQVVDVADRTSLKKVGDGQFAITPQAYGSRRPATGIVRQGTLELSGVEPVTAMLAVQTAARTVSAATSMIQTQDRMMERAINTFGRVG